jgi:hypothetical protein
MSKGWQFYAMMLAIGLAFGSAADAAYNARKANRAIQQIAAEIEQARALSKPNDEGEGK